MRGVSPVVQSRKPTLGSPEITNYTVQPSRGYTGGVGAIQLSRKIEVVLVVFLFAYHQAIVVTINFTGPCVKNTIFATIAFLEFFRFFDQCMVICFGLYLTFTDEKKKFTYGDQPTFLIAGENYWSQ